MTHRISVLRQNKTPLSFKCDNLSRNIPFPFSFATKIAPAVRAPLPCAFAALLCVRPRALFPRAPPVSRGAVPLRAPRPCPVACAPPCGLAVGRDVPIAPPRHCPRWLTAAVCGLASRIFRTQNSRRHYPRALPGRRDGRPWGLPTARGGSPPVSRRATPRPAVGTR